MKVSEKLDLIETISTELQARFSYDEIDAFLMEFEVPKRDYNGTNSKRVYAKHQLASQPLSKILKIAEDLDIAASVDSYVSEPPANWAATTKLKLFLSHISKDKDKATRLRDCLAPLGVSAFVAHEDIHPTRDWQDEILRALRTMDAFLSIHTKGFSSSYWTQQESGFAVARGVKLIAFKMGEDPTGFLSIKQALPRRNRTAEEIADTIVDLLKSDPSTAHHFESEKHALDSDDEIPF